MTMTRIRLAWGLASTLLLGCASCAPSVVVGGSGGAGGSTADATTTEPDPPTCTSDADCLAPSYCCAGLGRCVSVLVSCPGAP